MTTEQKSNAHAVAQGTMIILVSLWFAMLLFSCSGPTHGYNYKAHAAKNHKVGKQALKVNSGKPLTAYKCTHKKHK
jgi:hypothetical protein